MAQEPVTVEATLGHAASRLFIHLLRRGGRWGTKAELMRGAGIIDYRAFYRALAELVTKGLYDIDHERLVFPAVPSTDRSVARTEFSVPTTEKSVARTEPVLRTDSVARTENPVPSTDLEMLTNFELDLAEADELPADGDERQPKSNFQLRRKRQLLLIEQAWLATFPDQPPLQPLAAKQLLISARSSASTVYEAMLKAAERNAQYPLAYTRKLVDELAKQPPKPPKQPDTDEELGDARPVTAEMRASWERMERLAKRMGWNDEDED